MRPLRAIALLMLPGLAWSAPDDEAVPSIVLEEEAPPENQPDGAVLVLETLRVSAQRREENIQKVPVSVSAFTADTLRDRGVSNVLDMQLLVPGMIYHSSGPYTFPYLRGVGSNSFIPSVDSSIATLLDGVYSASIMTSFRNFADVERIEVLKGPQGTLFGRNTTAGVISIKTREPEPVFSARGALYGGSLDRVGGSMFATGPVGDNLALSLAGYREHHRSHYQNINPDGQQPLHSNNRGLRLKALYAFNDDLSLRLHGFETLERGAAVWENVRPSPDVQALGGETVDQPRRINNDRRGLGWTRVRGLDAKLSYQLDSVELWSLTAYQHTRFIGGVDMDGSNADYAFVFVPDDQFARALSQEIQIASRGQSRLEWLAGAYYSDGLGGWNPIDLEVGPQSSLGTLLLDPLRAFVDTLPEEGPPVTRLEIFGIIDNQAWSAFGELSYQLSPHWTATAGLRYSYEERILVRGSTSAYVADQPGEPIPLRDFRDLPADWNRLSPKLGLEWQRGKLFAWLSYAEGFKSGTWNPLPLLEPVSLVEPEKIRAWELGFKSDLLGDRLRLNGTVFHYDYRDLQVFVISVKSNGTAKVENAGRADIFGAELELTARPWRSLTWSLALAYNDATYLEFMGTGYDENGQPFQGDFAGNQLTYAPKTTLSTELAYQLPTRGGDLGAAVNWYHSDRFYFDAQNDFLHPDYGVLGARLSWAKPLWNTRLSLIGSNLTNTNYERLGILYDFGRIVSDAPGRSLLLRLDWQF